MDQYILIFIRKWGLELRGSFHAWGSYRKVEGMVRILSKVTVQEQVPKLWGRGTFLRARLPPASTDLPPCVSDDSPAEPGSCPHVHMYAAMVPFLLLDITV